MFVIRFRGFAVLAASLIAGANSAVAGDRTLAEIVSKDATLYAAIDVERAVKQWETLALVRLYHDPEVQAFIEPVLKSTNSSADLKKLEGLRFFAEQYGLPQIIDGKVEIAVVGYGMHKDGAPIAWCDAATAFGGSDGAGALNSKWIPELAVLIDTAGQESFGASLERALEIDPSIEVSDGEADGVPYHVAKLPAEMSANGDPIELYYSFVNDKFLLAMRESRLVELVKGLSAEKAPAESLGTDKSYKRWANACLRGGELIYAYVGLKSVMPTIVALDKQSNGLDQTKKSTLEAIGLDRAEGAGMRIGLENGRLSDSYAIVAPEQRTGLFRILDALQPGAGIVDNVKGNSVAHLEARVDPAMILNVALEVLKDVDPAAQEDVEKGFAEMSTQLGFDLRSELIASLGADVLFSATLPKSGFIPDVIGSIELRDPAKFQAIVPKLKEAVSKSSGGATSFQDIALKEGDPGFYLKSNEMLSVSPSFAVRDSKLLFSISTSGLKRFVGSLSKAPAPDASPSADLKACLATTVGKDIGSISGLFYVDLKSAIEWGLGSAQAFLPLVLSNSPIPLDSNKFPAPETVGSYFSGLLMTVRFTDGVVSLDGSSPIGGVTLPVLGLGTAIMSQQRIAGQRALKQADREAVVDPDQPYVGVQSDTSGGGVRITSVIVNSPAQEGGLLAGDKIVSIDGETVTVPSDMQRLLKTKKPGAECRFKVERENSFETVVVTIGRRGDYIR